MQAVSHALFAEHRCQTGISDSLIFNYIQDTQTLAEDLNMDRQ